MRWQSALLTASSALLLSACGGGGEQSAPPKPPPRIPASVASRLAAEAEQVAGLAPGSCEARDAAARFRAHVIASIESVPARYQEPLMNAANDLAERLAPCTAPPPREGHGKGKAKGKRKHDDEQGDEGG